VYFILSRCLAEAGELSDSLRVVKEGLIGSPTSIDLLDQCHDIYRLQGKSKEALRVARIILENFPLDPDAYVRLALDLIIDFRFHEALGLIKRATAFMGVCPGLFLVMMHVYALLGDDARFVSAKSCFLRSSFDRKGCIDLPFVGARVLNLEGDYFSRVRTSLLRQGSDTSSCSELFILAGFSGSGKSTLLNYFVDVPGVLFADCDRPREERVPGSSDIHSLRSLFGVFESDVFKRSALAPYITDDDFGWLCSAKSLPKKIILHLDLRELFLGRMYASFLNIGIPGMGKNALVAYMKSAVSRFWSSDVFSRFLSIRVATIDLGYERSRSRYFSGGGICSNDFMYGIDVMASDEIFAQVYGHWFEALDSFSECLNIRSDNLITERASSLLVCKRNG